MNRRDYSGEGNPNFKNAGWKICIGCGSPYHSYNNNRKYCTVKCCNKSKTFLNKKACQQCGELFKPATIKNKFCSQECVHASQVKEKPERPGRRVMPKQVCEECSSVFRASPSSKRKYCSYECFLKSGGPKRAGYASSVMIMKKYGAKKDANHKEVFEAISKFTAVLDLSHAGYGVPDGVAWVNSGWQLFDVKNPKTSYGRKGLNPRQKAFVSDWRGGPIFLIYSVEEAMRFAKGDFDGLKVFEAGEKFE